MLRIKMFYFLNKTFLFVFTSALKCKSVLNTILPSGINFQFEVWLYFILLTCSSGDHHKGKNISWCTVLKLELVCVYFILSKEKKSPLSVLTAFPPAPTIYHKYQSGQFGLLWQLEHFNCPCRPAGLFHTMHKKVRLQQGTFIYLFIYLLQFRETWQLQ